MSNLPRSPLTVPDTGELSPAGPNFEYWQQWEELGRRQPPSRTEVLRLLRDTLALDLRRLERAAELAARAGRPLAALRARVNAGLARLYLSDRTGAVAALDAAAGEAERSAAAWETAYAAFACGTAYQHSGRTDAAEALLSAAASGFAECGDRSGYGYTRLRQGAARTGEDQERARGHLLDAMEAFRQAGGRTGMLAAARALVGQETGRPVPAAAAGEPRIPEPLRVLTGREQEVAQLLATGLTNRQISKVASISERTVDTHVQRILAKLKLNTRVQVAVLVSAARVPAEPAGTRAD